jgi:hypothetical protein
MDKIVEDVITLEAEALAKKRNIADAKRVINVMKRVAIDCNGLRYEITRDTRDPLSEGLAFHPSLDEALAHLEPDKALSLFETANIDDLASKVSYFDFLTDNQTPFYTHEELAALIKQFIVYLKANKSSLLAIGYPAKSFEKSPWLYENLSRLYPVKIPISIQNRDFVHQKVAEADGIAERDNKGNLIFKYTWLKESILLSEPYDCKEMPQCSYDEAALIQGLSDKDVKHIEDYRSKVLNAKIEILEITHKYLCGEIDKDNFWNECFNIISKELTKDAFRCFEKIEEAYSRLFIVRESEDFRITRPSAITGGQPNLETGGINNILAFIFFIEAELKIGQMYNTKSALLKLTDSHVPSSYYDLVSSPSLTAIDEVIQQSQNDATKTAKFNELFDERLRTDSEKKLKMLLEVPSKNYDTVKRFSDLVDSGPVSFHLENAPSASLSSSKKITPIVFPTGAQWEDITIEFTDGHNIKIKCKSKTFRRDYKDMGFEDSKAHKPNKQWAFLHRLAENNGEIAWDKSSSGKKADLRKTEQDFGYEIDEDAPDAAQNKGFSIIKAPDKTKKTKQLLSQSLKAVFPIDGDPFYPYEEVKAYKIRLKLIP